ncbi:hypothetical protein BC829DRAFT_441003 [Chytridium lagenaria]|nr:hypothetical protein BC829DRAFT_441003 [Chytridium lagenaria]
MIPSDDEDAESWGSINLPDLDFELEPFKQPIQYGRIRLMRKEIEDLKDELAKLESSRKVVLKCAEYFTKAQVQISNAVTKMNESVKGSSSSFIGKSSYDFIQPSIPLTQVSTFAKTEDTSFNEDISSKIDQVMSIVRTAKNNVKLKKYEAPTWSVTFQFTVVRPHLERLFIQDERSAFNLPTTGEEYAHHLSALMVQLTNFVAGEKKKVSNENKRVGGDDLFEKKKGTTPSDANFTFDGNAYKRSSSSTTPFPSFHLRHLDESKLMDDIPHLADDDVDDKDTANSTRLRWGNDTFSLPAPENRSDYTVNSGKAVNYAGFSDRGIESDRYEEKQQR